MYRNAEMVESGVHAAAAFRMSSFSRGTNDAVDRLSAAGVPHRVYGPPAAAR